MKFTRKKSWYGGRLLLIALVAFMLITGIALAQGAGYSVAWWTVDGGGGTSTGSNYTVSGTIGQFDAGTTTMSGGNFTVSGGFWSAENTYRIFLPLILK